MNTKPTPGPWGIAPGFESTSRYRNHWRITAQSPHVAGKMQTICELNGPWDEENYQANAKLIAEAGTVASETGLTPRQLAEQRAELLEACKALMKAERMQTEGKRDGATMGNISIAIDKARQAIARAEGNGGVK